MSGQPYIDGATIDEVREAHRQGIPLGRLAGHCGCDTEYLGRLLGLQQHVPALEASHESDLWAADRLEGQL